MILCEGLRIFLGTSTFSIQILFMILVYTGATFYRILNMKMFHMMTHNSINGIELNVWKHQHNLVCYYVHLINRSFGPIILVAICHEFMTFITTFYELILAVQQSNSFALLIYGGIFARELFFLSIFIWTSYCLELEVLYAMV